MARKKTLVPTPAAPPATPPVVAETPKSRRPSVGDLLREAIARRDWSMVGEAYGLLTGEEVGPLPPSEDAALLARVRELLLGGTVSSEMVESPEMSHREWTRERMDSACPEPMPTPAATQKEYRPPFKYVRMMCAGCQALSDVHPDCVPRALDRDDSRPDYFCDACLARQMRE